MTYNPPKPTTWAGREHPFPPVLTMPVPDLIRDSFVGRVVYHASGRRLFRHPEEVPGFELPIRYTQQASRPDSPTAPSSDSTLSGTRLEATAGDLSKRTSREMAEPMGDAKREERLPTHRHESVAAEEVLHLHGSDPEKDVQEKQIQEEIQHSYIVDWYGPDDPECPENVSSVLSSPSKP